MKDIQNLHDDRRINIRKVGVKTISYPVTVLDKSRRLQRTIATVNMYVNLPHRFKGTHMSRFIEILNRFHGEINLKNFNRILLEVKECLDAEAAHLEIEFPYFLQPDPSYSIGSEKYKCRMHGSLEETDDLVMEIEVPITLVRHRHIDGGLPRSMGRWGIAKVSVRFNKFIWIEDLIALIEEGLISGDSASAPDSVESVCQHLGSILSKQSSINWYSVVIENIAAGYSTFASLEGPQN